MQPQPISWVTPLKGFIIPTSKLLPCRVMSGPLQELLPQKTGGRRRQRGGEKDAMKDFQQFSNIKQLCKTRKVAVGSSQKSALYPISALLNGEKLGRGPTLLLIF